MRHFTLEGATVLDAFAGSGSLGFESLSNGASHVTFFEKNPIVMQYLKKNISLLKLEKQTTVIRCDCTLPPQALKPVDLIFLDPPFYKGYESPAHTALLKAGWISEDTLICMESPTKQSFTIPEEFKITDQRRHGASIITFSTLQIKEHSIS